MNRKQPHTDQLTGRCILVPLEPTKEMLLAGSSDLRLGDCIGTLVRAAECWKAMLAASPTPPAEQQAAPKAAPADQSELHAEALRLSEILIAMGQGSSPEPEELWADGYEPSDGDVYVHRAALVLAMLAASPTPPAEQQATSDPLDWPLPCDITAGGVTIGKGCPLRTVQTRLEVQAEANALLMRHLSREQAAPKAAPGVGNSGFDHQTAADFLSGKTVSDEAVRKFVAASRWAHDEKAALSAMLLSVRGVLASREAEIALLKKALLEAEAAPQQEAQEPTEVPYQKLTNEIDLILSDPDTELSIGAKRALLWMRTWVSVPLYTAPQQEAQEPVAWLVTWVGGGHNYVQAHASELPAVDQGRRMAGTVTPLYTAPQPAPAPLSDDTALLDGLARLNWYVGPGDFYCDEAGGMNDYDDKNSGPEELRQAIRAALAAQGGK